MGRGQGDGRASTLRRGTTSPYALEGRAVWDGLTNEQLAADQQVKEFFALSLLRTEEDRRDFNAELQARARKAASLSDAEILELRRAALDDVSSILSALRARDQLSKHEANQATEAIYMAGMAAVQMEAMARSRGLITGPHLMGTTLH